MGHLVDYEEAGSPLEKALAALVVVEHKSAKALAWWWAQTAVEHAVEAGMDADYADGLLGNGRYPETDPLREALAALKAELEVLKAEALVVLYPGGYYKTFREGITTENALAHVAELFRYVAVRPTACSWLIGENGQPDKDAFAVEFDRVLEGMVGVEEARRLSPRL